MPGGGEQPPTTEELQTIQVQPLTASIFIDSTNGDTAPATFLFETDPEGGTEPYTFSWDFGDGQQGNEQFITHTYVNPGTYTVILTVTNSAGQTATDIEQVTVQPITTAEGQQQQPPLTNETRLLLSTNNQTNQTTTLASNDTMQLTTSIPPPSDNRTLSPMDDDLPVSAEPTQLFDCYYHGVRYSEGSVIKHDDGKWRKCTDDEGWITLLPQPEG